MTSEERNREVDAAWRAASAEEPPPQLDAAIRAEARRAVAAGPHDARRRRYRQLRYPFAAAATVALLAFGIAQMSPPDQVAPDVVSDQPPASRSRPLEPQAPAPATRLAENAPPAAPPAATVPASSPQAQSQPANAPRPSESGATIERRQSVAKDAQARKEVQRDAAPEGERFAAAPSQPEPRPAEAPPPPIAQPPANATAKLAQSAATPEPAKPAQSAAMPEPAKPAQNPAMPESANSGGVNVTQGAPRSEPFPAAPPKAAAAENPPSPNAPQAAGAPPAPRRDMQAETAKREQAASATPAAAAKSRSTAAAPVEARASNLDELKAKQAGAESVEAWIARIRALRSSGDLAAAGRELAAFRDTFGDRADALLPRDLRGFTASDGKGQ